MTREERWAPIVGGVIIFLAGMIVGAILAMAAIDSRPHRAVCHAPTEDSTPTDCVYDHGVWHLP